MAMWTMLGERGVDMLAWESFGSGWVTDAAPQPSEEPSVEEPVETDIYMVTPESQELTEAEELLDTDDLSEALEPTI